MDSGRNGPRCARSRQIFEPLTPSVHAALPPFSLIEVIEVIEVIEAGAPCSALIPSRAIMASTS